MLWTAANINQRGCVNKCAQEIAGSRHAGTRSSLSFALGTALQGDGHQLLRTQHQLPRPDTRTQLRLHALEMLSVLPGWPWRRARPPPQLPGGRQGVQPRKAAEQTPGRGPHAQLGALPRGTQLLLAPSGQDPCSCPAWSGGAGRDSPVLCRASSTPRGQASGKLTRTAPASSSPGATLSVRPQLPGKSWPKLERREVGHGPGGVGVRH